MNGMSQYSVDILLRQFNDHCLRTMTAPIHRPQYLEIVAFDVHRQEVDVLALGQVFGKKMAQRAASSASLSMPRHFPPRHAAATTRRRSH